MYYCGHQGNLGKRKIGHFGVEEQTDELVSRLMEADLEVHWTEEETDPVSYDRMEE